MLKELEGEKFLDKSSQGATLSGLLSHAHCSSPRVSFGPFFLSSDSRIPFSCPSVLYKH